MFTLLVLLCLTCHAAADSPDDWLKSKRKLTWGKGYEIPGVTGARTNVYTEFGKKGQPVSVGVRLTKAYLDNRDKIPCVRAWLNFKGLEKSCQGIVRMPFPSKSTFKYMMLDFNSLGHDPVGVYDVPHFDFHFFLMDLDTVDKTLNTNRSAVKGPCFDFNYKLFKKLSKPLPSKCFPTGYSNVGSYRNLMGSHLVNVTSHEFTKPNSFDATWIWGAFDGKISFFEPMITYKTLTSGAPFCGKIPALPSEFPKAGYYPSTYCYYRVESGDVYVELKDFTWYKAGCKKPKSYDGYLAAPPPEDPKCVWVKPPPTTKP